jgi:hypothetical protein
LASSFLAGIKTEIGIFEGVEAMIIWFNLTQAYSMDNRLIWDPQGLRVILKLIE